MASDPLNYGTYKGCTNAEQFYARARPIDRTTLLDVLEAQTDNDPLIADCETISALLVEANKEWWSCWLEEQ